jgi:hypothetical protein
MKDSQITIQQMEWILRLSVWLFLKEKPRRVDLSAAPQL